MTYSIRRLAALVPFLLLLGACSGPSQFSMPGNRFDLPETLPQGHYRVAVENGGITEVQMFEKGLTAAPRTENPKLASENGQFGFALARGMSERMEIELRTLPYLSDDSNGIPGLRLKYRLGETGNASNVSKALTGGVAVWSRETHTTGNPQYFNDLKVLVLDLGAVAAWRFSPDWQLYGGPWLTLAGYSGKWHRNSFGITDQKTTYDGNANQLGVNAGLARGIGNDWSLLGELAYSRLSWQDSDATAAHVGLQLRKVFR